MSGKVYNGEKACISLTTWRRRIHTVGVTLFSLLKQCPGFHIVLVLSEEEFPSKESELPDDLKVLVFARKIEILWVGKNVRSFKKMLWTQAKYPTIPVITADDDCIYTCNYAELLYNKWIEIPQAVVTCFENKVFGWLDLPNGYASLYPPNALSDVITKLTDNIVATNNDDVFIGYICHLKHIPISYIHKEVAYFHDEIDAMGATGKYSRGSDVIDIIRREYAGS